MNQAAGRLSDLEGRVILSIEEAAALLGIKRTAAYEAARRGELPAKRLGRRLVVPVPALREWLGLREVGDLSPTTGSELEKREVRAS